MKKTVFSIALIALVYNYIDAQTPLRKGDAIPQGAIVYALPSTIIEIQADAVHEVFTAGPYARYAQKYLGMEAETANKETCYLKSISLQATLEADVSQMYALEMKDKNAGANFLAFSGEGLIMSLDQSAAGAANFQFSHAPKGTFPDTGLEGNLGKDKVTLYKTVQTATGFEKTPVQQNQTVEKSPEKRAEEAANVIFNLRKKRIDLITGEIDGSISNDGLGAALKEIKRLEEEYLCLFLGKTTSDVQSAVFYVTPIATQAKQLYVAFRISDTQGLLPPDNVEGRPVTLELTLDKKVKDIPTNIDNSGKSPRIAYRLPETARVSLNDGQTNLLQTRLKIYQLGQTLSFPGGGRW